MAQSIQYPNVTSGQSWLKNWLIGFVALLLLMIAVGGVTRLTRSGLSIVEWRPFTGIVPPLSESQWQAQFSLYQKSPEYLQVNSAFSLADYKNIFMWEYLHRVLGRLIFFYALFPGLFFLRKKIIAGKKVFLFCSLVALQGLVGWLMVKSGLERAPEVSPFMLALHFFSALTVLVAVFYSLAGLYPPIDLAGKVSVADLRLLYAWGVALAIQIFYGCLTSGFKAGFAFNTYPLMGGSFFPPGGLLRSPAWTNFLQNPATIQWTHRWIGVTILALAAGLVRKIGLKKHLLIFFGIILVQVCLGVLNILWVVPIPLAVIHQVVATVLILSYLNIAFRLDVTP